MTDFVQIRGLCGNTDRHERHTFPTGRTFDGDRAMWSCPGVYVDCLNCDDQKCMDCVLRYWHDECEDSCPVCCGDDDGD